MGTITTITDSSGSLIEEYHYDPFGRPLNESSIGNQFMFTGREWDSELGLYYYRARYYDPEVGRFISADPIRYKDGVNLYAYVHNNPINRVDPRGLTSIPGPLGGGGTIDPIPEPPDPGPIGDPIPPDDDEPPVEPIPPEPEGPIGDPIPPDEGTHTWEGKPDIDYIDYLQDKYDLTDKERRQLHDLITKQGLTKEEIEELAKMLKDLRDEHKSVLGEMPGVPETPETPETKKMGR